MDFNVQMRKRHVVGLTQSAESSHCQHYPQHSKVRVCLCVCARDEHLESFAANPSFPQRSLNRENDMFSYQSCSYFILIAKLTPEQCLERASPHLPQLCFAVKGKLFICLPQWKRWSRKELSVCSVQPFLKMTMSLVEWLLSRLLVKLKLQNLVFVYINIDISRRSLCHLVYWTQTGAGSSSVELCNIISICQ